MRLEVLDRVEGFPAGLAQAGLVALVHGHVSHQGVPVRKALVAQAAAVGVELRVRHQVVLQLQRGEEVQPAEATLGGADFGHRLVLDVRRGPLLRGGGRSRRRSQIGWVILIRIECLLTTFITTYYIFLF